MPKEVGRCAGKSSRSRRSASSTVQVCETRARRRDGPSRYDEPSRSARVRARRRARWANSSSTKSWVRGPDAHAYGPPDVQVPRRPVELGMVATHPPRCTSRHTPGARACALRWGRPSFFPPPKRWLSPLPTDMTPRARVDDATARLPARSLKESCGARVRTRGFSVGRRKPLQKLDVGVVYGLFAMAPGVPKYCARSRVM